MRPTVSSPIRIGLAAALAAILLCPCGLALAQPTGVLLEPRLRGEDVDGVGHALDRVLRTRLQAHQVLALRATPALGLEDLQLAVGCVAPSADCLSAVATQLEVEAFVFLDVERAGTELVLTLSVFEVGGELETVTRRLRGRDAEAGALDAVDPMVREAFDLPAAEVAEPGDAVEPEPVRRPPPVETPPPEPGPDPAAELALPIALIGGGVLVLGAGLIVGLVAQDTQSRYEQSPVTTEAEVDAALALNEQAATEALVSNILVPVGGAIAVAGAVVWIIQAVTGGEEEPAAFVPYVGPTQAGLTVHGRFGSDR